jgi:hypothetical protein
MEGEWMHVGNELERKWDFPNCKGAVDGKHVKITPPTGSESFYWNYKGFSCLVLMSIANANYEFLYCDIGTNGRISDGGVFENIKFYEKLFHEELNLPLPRKPDNSTSDLLNVFVGDEAFALRKDLLKPFSQKRLTNERRVFNYRLSRARRFIENTFGIMTSRFRVIRTEINLKLERIETAVVFYTTCLRRSCNSYAADVQDESKEEQSDILTPLQRGHNRHADEDGRAVREKFLRYFNEEGNIP